ncbi:hypothetical protein V6N13_014920 [Hibiscus sabdariffa]
MNIPASFRIALPTPPLPPPVPTPQPPPPPPASSPAKPHLADASSIESEMESSDEEVNDKAHEAVGMKPSTFPLIKKNPFLQIKIAPKQIPNEQKDGDANDGHKRISEEPNREGLDAKQFASADELEKGKLPPEEILSLPMFKALDLISADCF